MKVIAVLGHKNSGKTRLASMLINQLSRKGYRVAGVKHVHHEGFSLDSKGKDSWVIQEAGANPVLIVSPNEVAVIWRNRSVGSLDELRRLAGDVDILVLEGFRRILDPGVIKIGLVKSEEEAHEFSEEIKATFHDLNLRGVYRLPREFPMLFDEICRRMEV